MKTLAKEYARLYKNTKSGQLKEDELNDWLNVNGDKISENLREKINLAIDGKIKEASTSSAAGPVLTPFAFSPYRKSVGNVRAAKQLGYKLAKPVNRSNKYALENQYYSEPAYNTPASNIELVPTYLDKDGLVQHGDPEMDPGLDGYKQCELPTTEMKSAENIINKVESILEGIGTSMFLNKEVDETEVDVTEKEKVVTQNDSNQQPSGQSQINVQTYDVLPSFTEFDVKLKNSTEKLKLDLQRKIQDKILDKKVVMRAAKGYKQPEMDYTVNVTGVAVDYYYDKYVIIVVGREENKQKTSKFFLKPGYKIKILGPADTKPKDKYQIAKSQALVDPDVPSTDATNVVTSPEPVANPNSGNVPPTDDEKSMSLTETKFSKLSKLLKIN